VAQGHRGGVGRRPAGGGGAAGALLEHLARGVHLEALGAGARHGQLVQVVETQAPVPGVDVEVAALAGAGQTQAGQHLVQDLLEAHGLQVEALDPGVQAGLEDEVEVRVRGGGAEDVLEVGLVHGDGHRAGRDLGHQGQG